LLLGLVTAFVMLAVGCGGDDSGGSPTATVTATASPTPTPSPTPTYNPTPSGSVDAVNVCGVNPDPAKPDEVQVTSPGPSDQVTSPLVVTGLISAFEAQFNIAIKDSGGNDIATAPGHSAEGQTLAPFSESVPFSVTKETVACVWVYDISAANGEPINVHQIPVYLEP
jgi:hypothetical protein